MRLDPAGAPIAWMRKQKLADFGNPPSVSIRSDTALTSSSAFCSRQSVGGALANKLLT